MPAAMNKKTQSMPRNLRDPDLPFELSVITISGSSLKFAYGRGSGVGRIRGIAVDLGEGVGVVVGVAQGVPIPWHQVMLTVSTRQPSPEPVESLAIRHRNLLPGV